MNRLLIASVDASRGWGRSGWAAKNARLFAFRAKSLLVHFSAPAILGYAKKLDVFSAHPLRPQLERALAGAIIGIALLLAMVWVFRVPMFQAPDENTHADYAFTLFSLKGPVLAPELATGTDVHPTVRYLEDASGFRSIRFNFDGRVAPGYGSAEFYRRVAWNAPRVSGHVLERTGGRVPWVARQYSYFYYALDAATIGLGASISRGSAVVEFFAARLFNVLLLGFSLVLSYLTLRELGMRPVLSLALLAAIGWFPLTSWMSGYVQPDNLAFTAVALVFYLSVRLRREADDLHSVVLLGLALGLLALTKSHYFAAVAIPALADRAVRFALKRPPLWEWFAFASLALAPAIVLGASALLLSSGVAHQAAAIVVANGNPLAAAASHGVGSLIVYLWTELGAGWRSVFFDGLGFVSYWGAISWTGFRIEFGPPLLTDLVFALLGILSALTFALMILRTIEVWLRLARVGKRGGALRSLQLLVRDVPLNSYLLFVVLIAGILISTRGQLGSQGRYWLPLILPAVLCAARYAPQVLQPRWRRPVALAFCAGLVLYSTLAAFAALAAINTRFYAPPAALRPEESQARFTTVGPYRIESLIDNGDRVFSPTDRPRVAGWALDSRSGLPARAVELLIDGRRIPVQYRLEDAEVVGRLHDDGLLETGFSTVLDLRGLAGGPHELRLSILERNRAEPYLSRARVRFTLAPR